MQHYPLVPSALRPSLAGAVILGAAICGAFADEVTDWNKILLDAALVPPATSPIVITRVAAIVHAAVFDAVNGIERRYTPIHVEPAAEPGASRRAAAVQAAYATLVRLYPSQKPTFDAKRTAALLAIVSGPAAENSIPLSLQRWPGDGKVGCKLHHWEFTPTGARKPHGADS